ncbi:oligosaccharide flippase family protein [Bacteroidales bacterium M08MB]|nr:oligosaccharide flippase family protein [Perlabentimonas gracilis]
MINSIKNFALGFLTKGHERTLRAKKNILASFVIKGLNIAIGLALVPLTINYLEPTKYGIWITLSSIIGWFGFFDIGLGHGLRNRFAEALAKGQHELARTYVSTTYAILTIIISGILILFFIVNPYLNWNTILNVQEDVVLGNHLSLLALIVFTFFCISFVLKLITTILTADQRPALASTFDLFGKALSLIVIFILTKTTEGSIVYLGTVYSIMPVVVLLSSSLWFFRGRYSLYRPNIRFIEFKRAKDLLNLGIKFFIIQISVIVLYQTNNIIISQLFGPSEVAPYSIAHKYMGVNLMIFSIIITPFWSAVTEAWVKKDVNWIKKIINKLIVIWFLLLLLGLIFFFVSKTIYSIWLGNDIIIPYTITGLVGVWIFIDAWKRIFNTFLNGIGKIKIQLYLESLAAFINVPLCIILGRKIGIEGILIANIIVTIATAAVYPIKYYGIIKNFNR